MTVSKTTLYSSTWTVIRNHLNDNLTGEDFKKDYKAKYIFSQRQYDAATGNKDYPYIVVNPVEDARDEVANDHTVADHNLSCTIEILSEDSESADLKGEKVEQLFTDDDRREELRADGIEKVNIVRSYQRPEIIDGEDIYVRYIILVGKCNL